MKLNINKRFKELHRQQTEEERKQLEADILEEGRVRDAIIVMKGDVILDGHNRYEIATKYKLPFSVAIKHFDSELAAEKWILRNQLARRNLTPHEFKIAIGRLFNDEKKEPHRPVLPQNEGVNSKGETAEKLADETGVSSATVERAGKRAEAYDKLSKAAKFLIDEKPSRATDKAVIALAKKSTGDQQDLARQVRTGQQPSFDAALGLKNVKPKAGKEPDPADEEFPEDETLEEMCERETSEIESWARQIAKLMKEAQKALEDVPTLDELNARTGWERKLNEALATLRATKPKACPMCEGDGGKKCPCKGHGRVTRQQYNQMV